MPRVLKGSHSSKCTTSLVRMNDARLSFPAEPGPHLPTPEGWKAELAWWLVTYADKKT